MLRQLISLLALVILFFPATEGCSPPPAAQGAGVCVYGESAHVFCGGRELAAYPLTDTEKGTVIFAFCGGAADSGLSLRQLPPGEYVLGDGDLPAAKGFRQLEGYTLPRGGVRLHWRFFREKSTSQLKLTVEETASLPFGWYDVFVDIGHGGGDKGAVANGFVEAQENLRSGVYLAELLRRNGLTVCLSRKNGAAAADPYAKDGRVSLVYRSHACYLISNHLNASAGGEQRGYQIYCSVRAGTAWAEAVSAAWQETGREYNDSGKGLVRHGIYQRRSEDDPAADYYFILRETGGEMLAPVRYRSGAGKGEDLRKGAQGLLLEYAFLDDRQDMTYWEANYQRLIAAAVRGCLRYWQIPQN